MKSRYVSIEPDSNPGEYGNMLEEKRDRTSASHQHPSSAGQSDGKSHRKSLGHPTDSEPHIPKTVAQMEAEAQHHPEWSFQSSRTGFTRETKIGLFVVAILMVAFGFVLFSKIKDKSLPGLYAGEAKQNAVKSSDDADLKELVRKTKVLPDKKTPTPVLNSPENPLPKQQPTLTDVPPPIPFPGGTRNVSANPVLSTTPPANENPFAAPANNSAEKQSAKGEIPVFGLSAKEDSPSAEIFDSGSQLQVKSPSPKSIPETTAQDSPFGAQSQPAANNQLGNQPGASLFAAQKEESKQTSTLGKKQHENQLANQPTAVEKTNESNENPFGDVNLAADSDSNITTTPSANAKSKTQPEVVSESPFDLAAETDSSVPPVQNVQPVPESEESVDFFQPLSPEEQKIVEQASEQTQTPKETLPEKAEEISISGQDRKTIATPVSISHPLSKDAPIQNEPNLVKQEEPAVPQPVEIGSSPAAISSNTELESGRAKEQVAQEYVPFGTNDPLEKQNSDPNFFPAPSENRVPEPIPLREQTPIIPPDGSGPTGASFQQTNDPQLFPPAQVPVQQPRYQPRPEPKADPLFPAPTYAQPRTSVQTNPSSTYTVQPNDNYWVISKKVYGTPAYFRALYFHNQRRIPDEKKMKPGMQVLTPPAAELHRSYARMIPQTNQTRKPLNPNRVQNTDRSGFFYGQRGEPMYRVGPNDTLGGIAHRHLGRASRWLQIYNMNRNVITNPDDLKIGTVVRLPNDASSVSLVKKPN